MHLHDFIESPHLRIQPLNMKDNYQAAHQNMSGLSLLHKDDKVSSQLREVDLSGYARVVVVDTR